MYGTYEVHLSKQQRRKGKLMVNRIRTGVLIFLALVVAIFLVKSIFFAPPFSHSAYAKNNSTCSRGSGCAHQYPAGLSSSLGSCTANSTVYGNVQLIDSSGIVQGQMVLDYNHNCDIWYGDILMSSSGNTLWTNVENRAESVFYFASNIKTSYTYTLYDGVSQSTVFVCAIVSASPYYNACANS